jgi:UDP-3-O-[3-hydroxymyristoyl] glucosamine N-acyltransferase
VTLGDLAVRLGCRLEGDGAVDIHRVAALDEAQPGDLTFLTHSKYASRLATTRASAVIVDDSVAAAPCPMLRSSQPYLTMAEAITVLTPAPQPPPTVSPLAAIDPTAEIGPSVGVGPFAVIGARVRVGARSIIYPHVVIGDDVRIGEDCVLHAHVSVRHGVTLGHRVILQDAAVIGSDGFGFARRADGSHQKIPQVGAVIIEDDVEVGAQSAVDRPAVGETRIGSGTKIDNLVQVAHGVHMGRHVLLAAQVGLAGSTRLGDSVVMAGQSGAAGHLHLGDRVMVSAKSAVTHDVPDGTHVAGIPAVQVEAWREAVVLVRKLPALRATVAALEARLAAVEQRLMP